MNLLRIYKISKITGIMPEGIECEIISFIKDILNNLTIFKYKDYPNSIFYMNSKGDWIFEQDNKNDIFRVRYYIIWKVLENKYNMKDNEIQDFIKHMVEEKLKQKISKPAWGFEIGFK